MLKRLLIANRGEIACRIIRSCRELGVETVAVYSEADRGALHARMADQSICIGPAEASLSYLNQSRLLEAARESGADSIHPGYGFLSENAGFAQMVIAAGLIWVGPPPEAIRAMGLKVPSRETARQAGVPLVPGFENESASDSEFAAAAEAIGFPLLVKASAGGGGKGMRLVESSGELEAALAGARREGQNSFGNPAVYLEKYIEQPRHIEIQLMADSHGNVLHFGERECSVQRRHQKVIEEAPSVAVSAARRSEMGQSAVAIARAIGYLGAGTIEFIADQQGRFYFLEMNTRLQVEHPVTELAYGVDLVRWQLEIASGNALPMRQDDIAPRGHSIEARIYAEDPANGFLPTAGTVGLLREPQGPGVRLDSMLYEGLSVGSDYDPLLAKLIVWGEDRPHALARMARALRDLRILGIRTNIPFLLDVIEHPAFAAGELDTGFIERHFADWHGRRAGSSEFAAAALALAQGGGATGAHAASNGTDAAGIASPWESLAGWSNV